MKGCREKKEEDWGVESGRNSVSSGSRFVITASRVEPKVGALFWLDGHHDFYYIST
jgi:hypothetical protein